MIMTSIIRDYGIALKILILSNKITYDQMNDLALLWIEMIQPLRTNFRLISITNTIMKHLEQHPEHIDIDETNLQFHWD